MVQKKKVYDKVMLLSRLKEESVIVVREVKQHLEYMRSTVGVMEELSSQLSEAIGGQGKIHFIYIYIYIYTQTILKHFPFFKHSQAVLRPR